MTFPIIDAHCHLSDYKSIDIRPGWLPVASGYSHSSNVKTAQIAAKYGVPFCLGIAPQSVVRAGTSQLDSWIDEIRKHKPDAIGEIGLDYHWAKTEEEKARAELAFGKMLDLADEMKLPVVIHARDAVSRVLDVLEGRGWKRGIMMHFYSGTLEEAERAVSLGALISICPLHSKERRKVINSLPINSLVVETDSPYVVRTFYEVQKAIDYISEVRGMEAEEVAEKTAANAVRFFNLRV